MVSSTLKFSDCLRSYIPSNYAIVICDFGNVTDEKKIEEHANNILKHLKEYSKQGVAFNLISEGLPYNELCTVDRIIKLLITKHGFPDTSIMIISGGAPCIENYNYYKEHCKRFGWIEVSIFFTNWWEYWFRFRLLEKNSIYKQIDTTPKIKPKKFLCYNRHVKPHRMYITTQCIKRNLLKDSFFSNYFKFPDDEFHFGSTFEWFPSIHQEMHDIMYENKNLFPLDLGLESIPKEQHHTKFMNVTNDDFYFFQNSYFAVITESKYVHDNYNIPNQIHGQLSLDSFMFTEKTYKFISAKKPFLLAGFTGSLSMLRKFGYKTFHPFIDESYDTYNDDEKRIIAIVDEIERLCKLSDDEWLEWQKNIEPILQYNYNHLLNSGEIVFSHRPNP